jgi:hypothetical protein
MFTELKKELIRLKDLQNQNELTESGVLLINELKQVEKLEIIANCLSSTFFYGDMVIETPNERLICYLLNELGLFPTTEEDIVKRYVDDEWYLKSKNYKL